MYINTDTLEYPVTERQIKAIQPNLAWPRPFVAPEPFAVVFPTPRTEHNSITQSVVEAAPQLTALGHWEQRWTVVDLDQQTVADNLVRVRAELWEQIKTIRDQKIQNGGYQAGGKWWHSDTFSRTQQMGMSMMGANLPADISWKTMDGTFITMTPQLAADVFAAAAAQDKALFTYAEMLNAQVQAASDPYSIDISAGWPAVFGDPQ